MRLPLADAVVSELNLYNRGIIPSMQGRISAPMKSDIKAKCILPHGNHIKNTKPCRAERRRLKSVYARNTKKKLYRFHAVLFGLLIKKISPSARTTNSAKPPGQDGSGYAELSAPHPRFSTLLMSINHWEMLFYFRKAPF